jgi:hypothetical protein
MDMPARQPPIHQSASAPPANPPGPPGPPLFHVKQLLPCICPLSRRRPVVFQSCHYGTGISPVRAWATSPRPTKSLATTNRK